MLVGQEQAGRGRMENAEPDGRVSVSAWYCSQTMPNAGQSEIQYSNLVLTDFALVLLETSYSQH
jgi:hypothetical protein